MYTPEHYKVNDLLLAKKLIREYPFATLISTTELGLEAVLLPVLLSDEKEDRLSLEFHMATANYLSQSVLKKESLLIFNGPHAYISPVWYENYTIPTWNYVSLHIKGRVSQFSSKEAYAHLNKMLKTVELDSPYAQGMHALNGDQVKRLDGHFCAFSLEVNQIELKMKCNQNKSADDIRSVISNLRKRDGLLDREMADWMELIN